MIRSVFNHSKEDPMPRKAGALAKPVHPDEILSGVVGQGPMPRTQIVKKLWAYIKKHNLQDASDRRKINADSRLALVFGKRSANMFEMTKLVEKHIN